MARLFSGCSLDQIHYGCVIKESLCRCSFGCKHENMYRTRRICLTALLSIRAQVCSKALCERGTCVPKDKGYVCKCDGTKHYGDRCEIACPEIGENKENIPQVCVS